MEHSSMKREELRQILKGKGTLLALGVSGMGMRALASLLCDLGHTVVGYDRAADATLSDERIRLVRDPSTLRPRDYSLVFYTLAMGEEWQTLLSGVPHASRAQVLGVVGEEFSHSIGVAGSHGKSTVTALLSHILTVARRAPTVVSGAVLPTGSTYLRGGRELLVLEACEYKRSFAYLTPSEYLYLNLELDHTDCYENIGKLQEAFVDAADGVSRIFLNADDKNLEYVKNSLQNEVVTFGENEASDYRAVFLPSKCGVHPFALFYRDKPPLFVAPALSGIHGARNTLAALAVALEEGVDPSVALLAIATFTGIERRMEYLGRLGSHPVYYDYAHHPTEIRATVDTLCERYGTAPTAVFAPHTYTRTRDLWDGFVSSLRRCRRALLLPIFPAREPPIDGITSEALARAIGETGALLHHPGELSSYLGEDEPLVLLGAGDLRRVLDALRASRDFLPHSKEQ